MKHQRKLMVISIFVIFLCTFAEADIVTTSWGGNAGMVYDTGFMHMLMKQQNGGVSLFNMDLIQNDAPGAGDSEKGVSTDTIWGKVRARKLLYLDDPRAKKAWLVFFLTNSSAGYMPKYPLRFKVNGHESKVELWDGVKNWESYRWSEFPAEWLVKGRNTIELSCPEAQNEKEGWNLYIARADEFADGGGDPSNVGKTSFKSSDGGETWEESSFGPLGTERAEYSVRISLDRYVKTGWFASPVIDLWKGDSQGAIVPQRIIQKMRLTISSDVPPDTKVEYFLRKGVSPSPFSQDWEPYEFAGSGKSLDVTLADADLNRRYVQFKAALSTENPLVSPTVKSAQVAAELNELVPLHKNIHMIDTDNPSIKYSSIEWEWEKWDRPEFKELRERENLDEVIAGSRTELEAQVKLLDYVTKRWKHWSPSPEYPGWDALSILNRVERAGAGGMCIQFNNTLAGLCTAYGWQARLVNVVAHEICEVWNDEFGKWIFMDADYENHYNYDPATDEPLSVLDLHRLSLDYYFPDRTIDWMNDTVCWMAPIEGKPFPVERGSLTNQPDVVLTGFTCSLFARMVPRNNWYEKPTPRPLAHGRSWWPWDGYINWYDDRTPPKRQYSWHTNRPQDMWPDLNKVHIDATAGFGNDRLFLRFETYTPNFSHFEVNVDDTGWKKVGERWTWLLQSGRNTLKARSVSMMGVKGKPSTMVLNHADAPFAEE